LDRDFTPAIDLRGDRRRYFNLMQIRIPEALAQAINMLGQATIPWMLISLGYRLSEVRSVQWGHALAGALLRIVGGFGAGHCRRPDNRRLGRQSPGSASLRHLACGGGELHPDREISPGSRIGGFCGRHQHLSIRLHHTCGFVAGSVTSRC